MFAVASSTATATRIHRRAMGTAGAAAAPHWDALVARRPSLGGATCWSATASGGRWPPSSPAGSTQASGTRCCRRNTHRFPSWKHRFYDRARRGPLGGRDLRGLSQMLGVSCLLFGSRPLRGKKQERDRTTDTPDTHRRRRSQVRRAVVHHTSGGQASGTSVQSTGRRFDQNPEIGEASYVNSLSRAAPAER